MPSRVNREFAFLRRVFNVAIRDSKTERNPVAKPGMLKEPSGRVRYLTDAEGSRLMKALPSDANRQRVTVLLQTGLRKSEFLGLRWKDVDIKVGVLTIPRSKNGETRHVPLTSTVRSIIGSLPRPLDGTASRLAMEGVDLLTIKELGGWKTLSMVQRYAHLSPGHRHAAIEQLVKRKAESYKARAGGME